MGPPGWGRIHPKLSFSPPRRHSSDESVEPRCRHLSGPGVLRILGTVSHMVKEGHLDVVKAEPIVVWEAALGPV